MGGDGEPNAIVDLARHVKDAKHLKVGWYSGKDECYEGIDFHCFDYIKVGHYDEALGGLDKRTTNQRLYKLTHNQTWDGINKIDFEDITDKFWR